MKTGAILARRIRAFTIVELLVTMTLIGAKDPVPEHSRQFIERKAVQLAAFVAERDACCPSYVSKYGTVSMYPPTVFCRSFSTECSNESNIDSSVMSRAR